MTSILLPLMGAKIWDSDPKANKLIPPRIIKEALILFETVKFQRGIYNVSYGETGTFSSSFPYRPDLIDNTDIEGLPGRFTVTATPESGLNPKPFMLVDTIGKNYQVCYEYILEKLSENCSKSELSFIKLVQIKENNPEIQKYIQNRTDEARGELNNPVKKRALERLCDEFQIPRFSADHLIKEAINAFLISQVFSTPVLVDPLHERYFSENAKTMENVDRVFNYLVPDFTTLGLADIIDLRKEPSISEFRKIMDSAGKSGEMNKELLDELLKDMRHYAPASKESIIVDNVVDLVLPPPFDKLKTATQTGKELAERANFEESLSYFCLKLKKYA